MQHSAENTLSSSSSISQSRSIPAYLPVLIWLLGCAFYFYEFLLQISPNIMTKDLMREFSVTAQGLGILSGIYFWPYALMQVPGGILLDRLGPQRVLTTATIICSLGALVFGLAPTLMIAALGRFMIGLGSAFAVIGTFKLAANWLAPERFSMLVGLTVAFGMMGAISAEAPLSILIETIDWRNSMILFGCLGLGLAVVLRLFVRDTPQAWINNNSLSCPSDGNKIPFISAFFKSFADLWGIIQHKQIWLLAIYGGLMYFPTLTFCGLWGTDFLVERYGLPRTSAGGIVSVVFIGWMIGGPLWGFISDKMHRRLPPMYIGCIGALLCSVMMIYVPLSLFWISTILFLFGFFSSGFLPAFSVVKESAPHTQTATAMGFMNMMNMLGAAFTQPLVGFVLDRLWNGEMINQTPHYSLENFQIALSLIPIGLLFALLTLPYIKETHCRSAIKP